jgi:peptide/nickel transport system substrate-binding protein
VIYRLLGPLVVSDGGRPVPLGEGRQRALLVLLLLHRNEPVSSDRLIDALWGEAPPPTAAKVLQNYVGRLRRALDDREGKRLQTRARTYVLQVHDGELDVERFERLVDEGGDALAKERPADAAARLREGLALWHGPALADVAYEAFAQPEIARLEERHLAALEQRIDADLALGRHADVEAELEGLVAQHPLRERLRAQLMMSLYRCGRQADALEAYNEARRVLLDELGVEPGPALRELQAAILRQDPELAPGPGAWPRPARPPPRRIALLAVGGALLLGAAVAAAVLAGGDGEKVRARLGADVVAAIHIADGAVTDAVDVGPSPADLAADGRALWVTNADGRSVSRVDLDDRAVRQTVAVGSGPAGVAVAAGAVWVANSRDGTVSRIDRSTSTVVDRIRVGTNPTGVAAGAGAVWVANSGEQTISRVDPRSGRATTIDVHAAPTDLAVGMGSVWISSSSSRTVSQLDPRSGRVVDVIAVGGGPSAIAVGHGGVWVANTLDGTVSRIAPNTPVVAALIPVGNGPNALAVDRRGVWVSEQFGDAVHRIDPKTNRVAEDIVVGNRPTGLALADGTLWVGLRGSGAAHRGGTLRVLGGPEGFDYLDPALTYATASIQFVTMTGDGLVAVQRAAGRDGTQIVPDLAVTLPRPQDGGRTYRFVLRPGIHYSTGGVVRARDVRASFERLWKLPPLRKVTSPGQAFFANIVGAARCTARPGGCDLSRGIVADPGNDAVVTFHLARPDPEFLYKLTLPFGFILPAGTPARAADIRPVPATGPYMVASYERNHRLVLTRNPRFREWSQAAQPDGYPDRIELRFDIPESRRVDAILRGEADYGGGVIGGMPPDRLRELLTQHVAQTHVEPLLTTVAMVLNTRVAPFDDRRVRRALNLGIERRPVVRAVGGSSAAAPTCQILPPNFPGYVRYCPYRAPDLPGARRLVAASGTHGMRVTVWSNRYLAPGARPVVGLLRRLGYHASLRVVPDDADYAERIFDSRARTQASMFYWAADYPAASNFLAQLLSCSAFQPASHNNLNAAEFCSPAIDTMMRSATRAQAVNVQLANRKWAAVDRAVVDAAPWLPLFNPQSVALLSRRAGGHRYNPIYGTLIDQLWVH